MANNIKDAEYSNEEYLISRARSALKTNRSEAKAWMLTAQTLFPHKFRVQFEAYKIEKSTNNVKEAAKCFAALITTFQNEPEFCAELQMMTSALRSFEESDGKLESAEYAVQLFYQLPASVQRGLLLNCAEKSSEILDHAKVMLLFFRKFPTTVPSYGPRLMEDLLTAEKHGPMCTNPVNNYRKLLGEETPILTELSEVNKLLVCDLLPLLAHNQVDLQHKSLLRLLDNAIEFYFFYIFEPSRRGRKEDNEVVEEPWQKLWDIVLNVGSKLGWDITSIFASYWNKDNILKVLTQFCSNRLDEVSQTQAALCTTLVMLRCAHEYLSVVEGTGEGGYILLEAFTIPDTGLTKPLKPDEDINAPIITVGHGVPSNLIHAFLSGVRCFDLLLHSTEPMMREYRRLEAQLKLDSTLRTFYIDAFLYHCRHDRMMRLFDNWCNEDRIRTNPIIKELILLTIYSSSPNYKAIVDTIAIIAEHLSSVNAPGVSGGNGLTIVTRHSRHIHFLPLTRLAILNYIVTVLLQALKQKKSDIALGHILVLIQLNWPAESELLTEITDLIQQRGGFCYPLFIHYIINLDILEVFSHLSSDAGPKIPLDIFPTSQQIHSQRRIATRERDKEAKEDFKMAIRGQVAHCNESIEEIILRFLKCEKAEIMNSLQKKL